MFVPIRINAGGDQYTDTEGNTWSADLGYWGNSLSYIVLTQIAGTTTQPLYQSERFGADAALEYSFAVPDGNYLITLKFAELYFTQPDLRVFDIAINGVTVEAALDLVVQAGGPFIAMDRHYSVAVSDGQIVLQFVPVVQNPKVNAIQIVAVEDPTPPPTAAPSWDRAMSIRPEPRALEVPAESRRLIVRPDKRMLNP